MTPPPDLMSAVEVDIRRPAVWARWRDFYEVTKPRMNFLVVITTLVGFYMAVYLPEQWVSLPAAIIGTALTAASASVFNQLVERHLDKKMRRTANRPIPAGRISPLEAMVYASLLGVGGIAILLAWVNPLTALLGLFTLASYMLVYTPLKRRSTLCTIVGAIPGAIPPVMGYTAVQNSLPPEAIALFSILFLWQMPHFLAIAILYKDDYEAGGFKMLPLVDPGLHITSRQMLIYSLALIPASLLPTILNMAGIIYFMAAIVLGLGFLAAAIFCARYKSRIDARRLFLASIIYLPLLLAAMMMDKKS